VTVQTLISELAVKAFHKGVLCWFPWLDKPKVHAGFLAPEEHGFAGANNLFFGVSLLYREISIVLG
jgi:hypothetical protein